jgi:glycosyltransferase involved in cell wall biosynthesis
VLWQGRFEYDKGGDRLLLLLEALETADLDYELALVGQQFRQVPEVFAEIEKNFSQRIVHSGYLADRDDYRALLAQADIVLSTALHEFQGLAVLEAVARGCLPLVPERQVYPVLFATPFLYPSMEDAPLQEASAAAEALQTLASMLARRDVEAPSVEAFTGASLATRYRQQLADACTGGAG